MAEIPLRVDGHLTRYRVRKSPSWWATPVQLPGSKPAPAASSRACGLWIAPCRLVMTLGMREAVDVVFLHADGTIARVVTRLQPWRAVSCGAARSALKLRAGLALRLGLEPGAALDLAA